MPAMEPLCHLITPNQKMLSRKEIILIEAAHLAEIFSAFPET